MAVRRRISMSTFHGEYWRVTGPSSLRIRHSLSGRKGEEFVSANDRDWLGLRDRVCVITGAASGIGRETATQFATVGATVVAIDRNGNGCSQTAEEVQKQGGAALALECDVFEAESVSVAASRALATSRIALALTACPISSMKIRNRGHCNSSFEHRAAPSEAIARRSP